MNTNPEVQQNWSELNPGDRVTVSLPGRRGFQATVESKTENSNVIWVLPDGDFRRAFHCREGVFMIRHLGRPRADA